MHERIILFTVPYLQEKRTATAGEIFLMLARLAMFWIVVQYESVGIKTAMPLAHRKYPTFSYNYSGSISHERARTS